MRTLDKVLLGTNATLAVGMIVQTYRSPDPAVRNGSVFRTLFPWVVLGIVVQDVADAHYNPERWR